MAGTALAAGQHSGGHGHSEETDHHAHDKWVDPPHEYADKQSHRWADAEAIARGAAVYAQQCTSCHGDDGRGTGQLAGALSHKPADLNNNFHTAPGNGDGYLFWRVSEGGTVEPFKSQGSAMPAFKRILTEDERWDVLSYVHTFFHQGLHRWSYPGESAGHPTTKGEEGMKHEG